jgi:hypothetical protein
VKKTYRFGWDYFGRRQIRFIKKTTGEAGMTYMKGVIRDTHETWDVQVLYPVYLRSKQAQKIQRKLDEQSTQPTPTSETQNPEVGSQVDAGAGGAAAEGTGE